MAVGREYNRFNLIQRAPKHGPQGRTLTALLRADVLGFTLTRRAAELSAQPSMVSRTYFGAYKPGTAQRIPPLVDNDPGAASMERNRDTLIARARLFRSSLAPGPSGSVQRVDAASSQAARIAGAK